MKTAELTELASEDWHLPYVLPEERSLSTKEQKGISAARCARASYSRLGKTSDIEDDLNLTLGLRESKHLTPFEHQATPMRVEKFPWTFLPGVTHRGSDGTPWSANFRGWIQNRQLLESEG